MAGDVELGRGLDYSIHDTPTNISHKLTPISFVRERLSRASSRGRGAALICVRSFALISTLIGHVVSHGECIALAYYTSWKFGDQVSSNFIDKIRK